MSYESFIPQWWTSKLLPILENKHAYKLLSNTDYEGEIKAGGDSVVINQISTPTVSDYTNAGGVSWEELQTTGQTLLIDKQKSISFYVNDIDKAQAKDGGALMMKGLSQAAYEVNDVVDIQLAALYGDAGIIGGSGAGALGVVGTPLDITVDGNGSTVTVMDWLGRMARRAAEGKLPDSQPKTLIVPPWLHQKMVQANILNARGVNNDGTFKTGEIQNAFGFNISVSNNVYNSSSKYRVMAGNSNCITFADQITEMEAVRREDYFSDGIKSLYVYGYKVVRPDQLMMSVLTEGTEA